MVIPRYKAYLNSTADVEGFIFEETTGINAIKENANNRYFNLQGVEVAQPTKGLYIVNGKKVLVK